MRTKDNAKFHIVAVKGWVEKDGNFLMARRGPNELQNPNMWSLPGGKVDDTGEEHDVLRKTLQREIEEEVGIEIRDDIELINDSSFIRSDGSHVVMLTFLCHHKSGEARPLEDTSEIGWFSAEDLRNFNDAKEFLKVDIQKLLARIGDKQGM